MRIRVWGARGSLPAPGPAMLRYGGHTSCVSVDVPGEPTLILDAGTGIVGLRPSPDRPPRFNLFLTHLHWDHIIGLPFFYATNRPDAAVEVYGPAGAHGLRTAVDKVICPPGFPIDTGGFLGHWGFHDLTEQTVDLGGIAVTARNVRHRGPALGYRVEAGGCSFAYISDHGPGAEDRDAEEDAAVPDTLLDLLDGADLLFHDAQYTDAEYEHLRHFGHTTPTYAAAAAAAGNVRCLVLFHHDPRRTDDGVDQMLELGRKAAVAGGFDGEVMAAAEGDRFELAPGSIERTTG